MLPPMVLFCFACSRLFSLVLKIRSHNFVLFRRLLGFLRFVFLSEMLSLQVDLLGYLFWGSGRVFSEKGQFLGLCSQLKMKVMKPKHYAHLLLVRKKTSFALRTGYNANKSCKFGWCHSGRKMTGVHASLAASGTFSFITFRRVFCRLIPEWDPAVSGGPMLY
ncbi:hypothetical protein U1Q18_048910 [Sarracenia purpurea var. burkii]